MDTVTLRYVGPGSDTDKRTIKVSPDEAARLEARGLYKRVTKRAASSKKKEANDA